MKLLAPSYGEHVMLLCRDQEECISAAVEVINDALKAGQMCVYASVLNGDSTHVARISSSILNFDKYVKDGDLLVIDFEPFAEAALHSNLTPFVELKEQIENRVSERSRQGKSDKVLIFAEAAGKLVNDHNFEESINLEKWWNDAHAEWLQNKKLNVTIICPHPNSVLNVHSASNIRNSIAHVHTLSLELEKIQNREKLAERETRILIVEPEPDHRLLYRRYLDKLGGIQARVTGSAKEALQHVLSETDRGFDLIILDANLKDASVIEIAHQITSAIPGQRIVITTTSSITPIKEEIASGGLFSEQTLVKPFSFSKLMSLIKAVDN